MRHNEVTIPVKELVSLLRYFSDVTGKDGHEITSRLLARAADLIEAAEIKNASLLAAVQQYQADIARLEQCVNIGEAARIDRENTVVGECQHDLDYMGHTDTGKHFAFCKKCFRVVGIPPPFFGLQVPAKPVPLP